MLQVLTEFILVSITSAVTVTIAGVVKEAVTILVSSPHSSKFLFAARSLNERLLLKLGCSDLFARRVHLAKGTRTVYNHDRR